MALELKEHPNDRLDDDKNPAGSSGDASVSAGLDQLEAYANDPSNASKSVAAKEAGASSSDGQSTAATNKEKKLADDDKGDSFKNSTSEEQPRGIRQKVIANRKKLGLGVGGIGVTVGIVGMFIAAPSFIMSHLSTLMTDKMGALEASHQARYRQSKFSKFTDRFSIDGRRGGAVIAEMERFGYTLVFDPADGSSIQAIRRPDGTYAPNSVGAVDDEIKSFLDKRYSIFGQPTRSARWKTARMEAFYNRYNVVSRQSIIKRVAGDDPDPDREINKRSYNNLQGDDELDSRVRAPDGENADELDDNVRAGRDLEAEGLRDEPGIYQDDVDILKEGGDVSETKLLKYGSEIDAGYSPGAIGFLSGGSALGASFGFVKGLLNPTEVADKTCSVKNKLNQAQTLARAISSVQLMRAGFSFISADDGQRKGDAAANLTGAYLARVTSADATLGNFGNSTNYQFATTGMFSKSKNDITRSSTAVDGKLSGVWGLVKDKVDWIRGCAVWQNPFFQGAAAVATVVVSIFTFGGGGAALTAGANGARIAFTQAFNAAIRSAITKRALVGIAAGVAIDIGFDQILALASLYAQKKITVGLTGQEQGALFASVLFAGAGVMHKQRGLLSGQVPATTREFAQANQIYLAEKREENKQKSFAERIFDINNTDSLAHQSMTSLAFGTMSPGSTVKNFTSNLALSPLNFANSFTSTLTTNTFAQDDDLVEYDTLEIDGTELATDPSGNLRTVMPEWLLNADEIANRDQLIEEGMINANEPYEAIPDSEFDKHLQTCVYSADTISPLEAFAGDKADQPEFDCRATLFQTRKYKIHLAYLDSNDFMDGYLFPEEISDVESRVSGGSGNAAIGLEGLTGPIIPCQGEPKNESDFFGSGQNAINWDSITPSGIIGQDSAGGSQGVYVRDACAGQTNIRTVIIGSSIHGSENGGQRISFELLYNADLPDDVRIIAIPEVNKSGIASSSRKNSNGVNLNRNFDYRWGEKGTSNSSDGDYYGPSAVSEPETQNVQNFLRSIGKTNLFISYHDCINWVAPSGPNSDQSRPLAQIYANLAPQESGSCNGSSNSWRLLNNNQGQGFMEAWYANETGTRSLLVELNNSESADYMKSHANVVKKMLDDGVID